MKAQKVQELARQIVSLTHPNIAAGPSDEVIIRNSSIINKVGFRRNNPNSSWGTLFVTFVDTNETYSYNNVHVNKYGIMVERALNGESVGSYFSKSIRTKYLSNEE